VAASTDTPTFASGPASTKTVFVDAGKPINTSGQPTITSCGPDLVGIDGP
jgi:hypothetical protein